VLGGEDEDAGGISIFDAPAAMKKGALSEEDRRLVRLAHETKNPALRRSLLRMVQRTVR